MKIEIRKNDKLHDEFITYMSTRSALSATKGKKKSSPTSTHGKYVTTVMDIVPLSESSAPYTPQPAPLIADVRWWKNILCRTK